VAQTQQVDDAIDPTEKSYLASRGWATPTGQAAAWTIQVGGFAWSVTIDRRRLEIKVNHAYAQSRPPPNTTVPAR
jgi:hypothetical protein